MTQKQRNYLSSLRRERSRLMGLSLHHPEPYARESYMRQVAELNAKISRMQAVAR